MINPKDIHDSVRVSLDYQWAMFLEDDEALERLLRAVLAHNEEDGDD